MYSGLSPVPVVETICRLVYTQGFLFLSGFGLFHSYTNDSNIRRFYVKRINRLYIPFGLIAFGFLALSCYNHKENVCDFIAYMTTVAFWYKGNYFGMWYVAVSLLLYIMYPAMHKFFFYKSKGVNIRCMFVIVFLSIILILFSVLCPNRWALLEQWIIKIPMFPIGMLAGYYAKKKCTFTLFQMFLLGVFFIIAGIIMKFINHYCYELFRVLIGIPLIVSVLCIMDERPRFNWIFISLRWLGKYSLEIYLLHLFIYWSWYQIQPMNEAFRIIIAITITLVLCKPVHAMIDKWQHSKYYFLK